MVDQARNTVRFLLNSVVVELNTVASSATLLDFLRLDRKLRGTKEGCAEGDCGACTVLVGRLFDGALKYETVNACIRFVGSLDGCHIVTVEALADPDGTLHPVQQAMVDTHASQCGFCTPGFVMSLYGLWMHNSTPTIQEIEKALQGNLCRCTGYAAIIRAAQSVMSAGDAKRDPLVAERANVIEQLSRLKDGRRVEITDGEDRLILPANVDDLALVLEQNPNATIVSGSTDVGLWVTKLMRDISPAVFLSHLDELRAIRETDDALIIGAGVSYSDAYPAITHHFPQLRELWDRIGGEQVRNMGTIGGNIANGSPIGDTPPALIGLEATVVLRKGGVRRKLALEKYFLEYGKQDRGLGEFVEEIHIPLLGKNEHFATYKITKRMDEDISAVCGAFRIELDAHDQVKHAIIAFGGMAGTPKRAKAVEAILIGKVWNEALIDAAISAFSSDFQPLTDWRASADYRLLVAQNLLRRFYFEVRGGVTTRLDRSNVAVA